MGQANIICLHNAQGLAAWELIIQLYLVVPLYALVPSGACLFASLFLMATNNNVSECIKHVSEINVLLRTIQL